MIVNAEVFSRAISNVQVIASLDKKQPGIMLTINSDNTMRIYYNTGARAIEQTIEIITDEKDYFGDAIFDYKKLTETVAYCKGSGRIKAEQIEVTFEQHEGGNNTALFHVVKTIEISQDGNTETRIASDNDYMLSWKSSEKLNMQERILSNPACPDMFDENGCINWGTDEFNDIINQTCHGNAKTVYFSPKYNGAFTVSTTSSTLVRTKAEVTKVIPLVVPMAKAIASVVKGYGEDTFNLNVATDEKNNPTSCIIFSNDHKLSIYTAAAQISGPDLMSMARYSQLDYKSYQSIIIADVVKDILKAAVNLSSGTQGGIAFEVGDGCVDAVVTAENTNASVSNVYKMHCSGFNTLDEITAETKQIVKCPVDLKQLMDIIGLIKTDFVALDIEINGKAMFLRVSAADLNEAKLASEAYKKANGKEGEKLTMEEKLDIRKDYLYISYFLPLKQG